MYRTVTVFVHNKFLILRCHKFITSMHTWAGKANWNAAIIAPICYTCDWEDNMSIIRRSINITLIDLIDSLV